MHAVSPTDDIAAQLTAAQRQATPRFTLDGDEHLEHRLAAFCRLVAHEVQRIVPPKRFEGLLLGGGYGRGEGGVLHGANGDELYNDVEFYVFIRGNNRANWLRFNAALHKLGVQLTPVAGVDVEFKIVSTAMLRRARPGMFFYDLVAGHRQFAGAPGLVTGCRHLQCPTAIPLGEATRLMMNRCSGLLFAREKLSARELTPRDADFIGRNLAKAQLGFGDVVLTAFGKYHWSCLERHDRLRVLAEQEKLPWLADVCRHHGVGARFKLHPFRAAPDRESLQKLHDELSTLGLQVWLWLEERRLGHSFVTANAYALCTSNKWPNRPAWYNCLANFKVFRTRAFFQRGLFRHPRERVLNMLALLLWEPRAMFSGGNVASAIARYRDLWRQVN